MGPKVRLPDSFTSLKIRPRIIHRYPAKIVNDSGGHGLAQCWVADERFCRGGARGRVLSAGAFSDDIAWPLKKNLLDLFQSSNISMGYTQFQVRYTYRIPLSPWHDIETLIAALRQPLQQESEIRPLPRPQRYNSMHPEKTQVRPSRPIHR